MKKIFALVTVFLLIAIVPVSSASILKKTLETRNNIIEKNDEVDWTGNFTALIGYLKGDSEGPEIVAGIAGLYKLRGKGGFFAGKIFSKDKTEIGTIRGIFGKNIFVGKITGEEKTIPVIGFISFNKEKQQIIGRGMSIVGPTLYFAGRYSEY